MQYKLWRKLTLVLISSSFLVACSKSTDSAATIKNNNTLRVDIGSEIPTFDPAQIGRASCRERV